MSGRAQTLSWAAVAALLVALATLVWENSVGPGQPWANHDVAYYLYMAQQVLEGQPLYTDQLNTNPPGIVYVNLVTTQVGGLLGAPAMLAHHLFLVVWAGMAASLVWRSSAGAGLGASRLIACLIIVLSACIPGVDPADFGQREHLFSIGLLAYLYWTAHARTSQASTRLLAAAFLFVLGALASSKPFFVLMLLATELWADRRRQTGLGRGLVWAALGAGTAAPFLALGLQSPASFKALLWDVAPLHFGGQYRFYDNPLGDYLASAPHIAQLAGALAAGLLGVLAWPALRTHKRALAGLGTVFGVAYVSVFLQRKYWAYHCIPAIQLGVASAVLFGAAALRRLPPAWPMLRSGAPLAMVLIGLGLWGQLALRNTMSWPRGVMPCLRAHVPDLDRAMVVSTSIEPGVHATALVHGIELVDAWNHHVLLPALMWDLSDNGTRALAAYVTALGQRIDAEQPEVVAIGWRTQALPPGAQLHQVLVAEQALFPRAGYAQTQLANDETTPRCQRHFARWTTYVRQNSNGEHP